MFGNSGETQLIADYHSQVVEYQCFGLMACQHPETSMFDGHMCDWPSYQSKEQRSSDQDTHCHI